MNKYASDAHIPQSYIGAFDLRSQSVVVRVCNFCLYLRIKRKTVHTDTRRCQRKVLTTRRKKRRERKFTTRLKTIYEKNRDTNSSFPPITYKVICIIYIVQFFLIDT